MIYKDEKLHNKYVVNIIFDGASPWNYLQTTEMGSLMYYNDLKKAILKERCFFKHQLENEFRLNDVKTVTGLRYNTAMSIQLVTLTICVQVACWL